MPVLDINGSKMAYWDMGNQQGPPVVLLHGLLESKEIWTTPITLLQDKFRLIVPDQRNHGETVTPENAPTTAADYMADVRALLDKLGITKPYALVGHSWGGVVSQLFGQTYQNGAGRLVLCNTMCYPPKSLNRPEFSSYIRQRLGEPPQHLTDFQSFAQLIGNNGFNSLIFSEKAVVDPAYIPQYLQNYSISTAYFTNLAKNQEILKRYEASGDALHSFDFRSTNKNIRAPCFVIDGRNDELVTLSETEELKKSLPSLVGSFDLVTGHVAFTTMQFLNALAQCLSMGA